MAQNSSRLSRHYIFLFYFPNSYRSWSRFTYNAKNVEHPLQPYTFVCVCVWCVWVLKSHYTRNVFDRRYWPRGLRDRQNIFATNFLRTREKCTVAFLLLSLSGIIYLYTQVYTDFIPSPPRHVYIIVVEHVIVLFRTKPRTVVCPWLAPPPPPTTANNTTQRHTSFRRRSLNPDLIRLYYVHT